VSGETLSEVPPARGARAVQDNCICVRARRSCAHHRLDHLTLISLGVRNGCCCARTHDHGALWHAPLLGGRSLSFVFFACTSRAPWRAPLVEALKSLVATPRRGAVGVPDGCAMSCVIAASCFALVESFNLKQTNKNHNKKAERR
jgi:hypothetical protein